MPIDYTEYNGVTYIDKLEYSEGPEDDNEDGLLGETYYRTQWAYVKSLVLDNDFASDEVYEEFCSVVDVDNLMDYMIIYMHAGNDDWPGNNMKFWRVTEESINPTVYAMDGKWRFMIHDFDISYDNTNHNTLYLSTMQKDANTQARHPQFATDLFEGLFKNEDFRNEFAQRSMVYLRTIMRGTTVAAILDELAAEREAGKSADIARWGLGSLNGWKNNINNLKSFASGRPTPFRNQYMDVFNKYYNAGITGVVLFNISGDEAEISGGKVKDGDELKMFSGIPVEIESEGSYITAVGEDQTFTGFGRLEFVPEGNFAITVTKVDPKIVKAEIKNGVLTAEIFIDESKEKDAKLYIAGYNKNDELVFAKAKAAYSTEFVESVEKADFYRLFVWNAMTPVTECREVIPVWDEELPEEPEQKFDVSDDNDNIIKDITDDNFDSESDTM